MSRITNNIPAVVSQRQLAVSQRDLATSLQRLSSGLQINRGADDPTLVMKLSDRHVVPGNRDVDAEDVAARIAAYHRPYHDAIAAEIAAAREAGTVPVLISMHSFTPAWKGRPRPWEIGVLWDRDDRLARPLSTALEEAGFVVGENEPYSGELERDCLYTHGTMNGLPHVLIEMRQDLVATPQAARDFALRLKPAIDTALAAMGPPEIRYTRALVPAKGEHAMDEATRTELEAAVFRRLVAHLQERTDVQNIDMMILAGFCRNCLGDWYREAAAEKGVAIDKDTARGLVYGMHPGEWKTRYQTDVTPEKLAEFEKAHKKAHS